MDSPQDSPRDSPRSASLNEPFLGRKLFSDSPRFAALFPAQLTTWQKTKRVIIGVLVLGIIALGIAVPLKKRARSSSSSSSPSYSATANVTVSGTTLLIDNDLLGAASTKSALIMLGPRTYPDAAAGCKALGEALWGGGQDSSDAEAAVKGIRPLLDYLMYQGHAGTTTRFWIGADSSSADTAASSSSSWRTITGAGRIAAFNSSSSSSSKIADTEDMLLSAFCTQSAPYSNRTHVLGTNSPWKVRVRAAADRHNNSADGVAEYVGNRDHNSFRFLGIRYAPEPQRFTYPTPYWNSTASRVFDSTTYAGNTSALPVVQATSFGSYCAQSNRGSEDCLFLNIYTPYLPPQSSPSSSTNTNGTVVALRPVMFWIHGGGFAGGSGSDAMYDGGNFASRGDVVVVTINYRVNTFGYLALDEQHGGLNGNYGLADQILALDWVRDNIAAFGGDPDRITIAGQSAGAASVRALMASPLTRGKFVAALPMSNLGGLNYGKAYSEYNTIEQSTNATGTTVIEAANCTGKGQSTTPDAIVDCLRAVPHADLSNAARSLVVDGTYLVSSHLELSAVNTTAENMTVAPYALLMGVMRDDGAPFIDYPSSEYTLATADAYLEAQGYTNVSHTLFPIPSSDDDDVLQPLFNMSARLSTDAQFRCIDEATVYAGVQTGVFRAAYYYEFDRSYQMTGWPAGGSVACSPAATTAFPHGDLRLPYFRCHSGDLYYFFGNVRRENLPLRDDADLPFMQYVVDSFASFVRTQSPNPPLDYLRARGFADSLRLRQKSDTWAAPTVAGGMAVHKLDWPASKQAAFPEQPQCGSLGLGLEYYLS